MEPPRGPRTLAHYGSSSDDNHDSSNNHTSFALKVAGWLVPDVRRHLFLLVWVCGIPVHIRYVVHLLRISAVSLDMSTMEENDPQQYGQRQDGELNEEEKEEVSVPCERTLRSTASDILFVLVANDCSAANEKVRRMCLSQTEWSEVRSLIYSGVSNGDTNNTTTQILSQEATIKGEVLTLVPAGGVPLAELHSLYFTALDQARQFERQYTCCRATPSKPRDGARGEFSCMGQEQQQGRHTTLPEGSTGIDVIVVDSEEGGDLVQDEVVVLSDDSKSSDDKNSKRLYCTPAKQRRTLAEDIYEVVD